MYVCTWTYLVRVSVVKFVTYNKQQYIQIHCMKDNKGWGLDILC